MDQTPGNKKQELLNRRQELVRELEEVEESERTRLANIDNKKNISSTQELDPSNRDAVPVKSSLDDIPEALILPAIEKAGTSLEIKASSQSIASEDHPERNEDKILLNPNNKVWGVFDGMGGHAKGEEAAKMASSYFGTHSESIPNDADPREVQDLIEKIIQEANKEIIEELPHSGTTASIIKTTSWEGKNYAVIANIGDSRVYSMRAGDAGGLVQETDDDDAFQYRENRDQIRYALTHATSESDLTEEELSAFSSRNQISNSLGSSKMRVNFKILEITPDIESFLITSDGIHDNLAQQEMQKLLNANAGVGSLVDAALERSRDENHLRHKKDDMSAVLLEVERVADEAYAHVEAPQSWSEKDEQELKRIQSFLDRIRDYEFQKSGEIEALPTQTIPEIDRINAKYEPVLKEKEMLEKMRSELIIKKSYSREGAQPEIVVPENILLTYHPETPPEYKLTQEDLDILFSDFEKESGHKIELQDIKEEEKRKLAEILSLQKSAKSKEEGEAVFMEFAALRREIVTRKLYEALSSSLDMQLNPGEPSEPWSPEDLITEKIQIGNIISYKGKEYRVAEQPGEKNRFKFVLAPVNPKDLTQRIDSVGLENILFKGEAKLAQYSEMSLRHLEKGVEYSSKFFKKIQKNIDSGKDEKSIQESIRLFEELFDHARVWRNYPDSPRARKVADIFESQASELKRMLGERTFIEALREQYGDEYANIEKEKRALKKQMAELRKLIESLED